MKLHAHVIRFAISISPRKRDMRLRGMGERGSFKQSIDQWHQAKYLAGDLRSDLVRDLAKDLIRD